MQTIYVGRMIRRVLAATLVVILLGCRTVNESRLVGTYLAKASCLTITVGVNSDHSFLQTVMRTTVGETNRLAGKWSVDKKDRVMTFEPFLDFLNDEHGRKLEFASFRSEIIGPVIEMVPIIVKCRDSVHELYYVK